MNQRDTSALPWADLDPGSGSAVIVPFPHRARIHPPPTPPSKSARQAVDRCTDAIHALRKACADLAAMLESLSASARALERTCRETDEQLQAMRAYSDQIVERGATLTTTIKRFRKRLVATVLADA